MEFISLRSLQRGEPKVWETLKHENGRIVLTNNSQPAYLLIDLEGQSVIPLINWIDFYRENTASASEPPVISAEQTLNFVQKSAAKKFLSAVRIIRENGLSEEERETLSALESGEYRLGFDREPKL